MALVIRRAQFDDAPLLSRLGECLYRSHFSSLWISKIELTEYIQNEYSVKALQRSLSSGEAFWYIAKTEFGQPVGFMMVNLNRTIPYTTLTCASLNKLYLASDKTGKRYGRMMFELCVQTAREHGSPYIWLEVLEQNLRAKKFYESMGMNFIRSIPFATKSQTSTLYIMGMAI